MKPEQHSSWSVESVQLLGIVYKSESTHLMKAKSQTTYIICLSKLDDAKHAMVLEQMSSTDNLSNFH